MTETVSLRALALVCRPGPAPAPWSDVRPGPQVLDVVASTTTTPGASAASAPRRLRSTPYAPADQHREQAP